jgi:ribosomal protein S18 acetylase RimI-like enzyme
MNKYILHVLLLFCCISNASEGTVPSIQPKIIVACEHWLKQVDAEILIDNSFIRLWISPHKDPYANTILFPQFNSAQELVAVAHEIKKLSEEKGVPITWWIAPFSQPYNSSQILKNNGFSFYSSITIMEYQLDRPIKDAQINHDIYIKRIDNANDAHEWSKTLADVYGYDLAFARAGVKSIDWNNSDSCEDHIFAGYFQNKMVTTGTLFIKDDWAELGSIATVLAGRNKGVATAIVLQMLLHAQKLCLKSVILMATPEGKNLYTKLGFETIYEIEVYKCEYSA